MSHFTVLVIGENPEEQLAPYHEYECTWIDDQYVIDVDCTNEVNEHLDQKIYVWKNEKWDLDYHYEHGKDKLKDPKESSFREYYKLAWISEDIEIKEYFWYEKRGGKWFNYTNPNAKWDWYLLGGRWSGIFKLKDWKNWFLWRKPLMMWGGQAEEWVDQAKKWDIDFDCMRKEARERAGKKYDKFIEDLDWSEMPPKWSEFIKDFENIDKARESYNEIEWVKKLKGYWGFEDLLTTREEYVKDQENSAFSTFAVIKDGKWYEKGEMGWWSCVSNEKEKDQWNEEFRKLIDSVSDDTLLSVYDCHI